MTLMLTLRICSGASIHFLGILAAQDKKQSLERLFSSFYVVHYSEPDWTTNKRYVVLTSFNMQLMPNSL